MFHRLLPTPLMLNLFKVNIEYARTAYHFCVFVISLKRKKNTISRNVFILRYSKKNHLCEVSSLIHQRYVNCFTFQNFYSVLIFLCFWTCAFFNLSDNKKQFFSKTLSLQFVRIDFFSYT